MQLEIPRHSLSADYAQPDLPDSLDHMRVSL